MIQITRISGAFDLNPELRQIYEESFPPDERRSWIQMTELLVNPDFKISKILKSENLIGFISIWELAKFRFIEHFAISSQERSKGYGSEVISKIISESWKPVVLEVEEPISVNEKKRIEFYTRLNFNLMEYEYYQPPYSSNKNMVKMQLMSYPKIYEKNEFEKLKLTIYNSVYDWVE